MDVAGKQERRILFPVALIDEFLMNFDDLIDGAILDNHFLMVTPTLSRTSCFNVSAHFSMNSLGLLLVQRHLKIFLVDHQVVDIALLFLRRPMVLSQQLLLTLFTVPKVDHLLLGSVLLLVNGRLFFWEMGRCELKVHLADKVIS